MFLLFWLTILHSRIDQCKLEDICKLQPRHHLEILTKDADLKQTDSFIFTSCKVRGRIGPREDQCQQIYKEDYLNAKLIPRTGIQVWRVQRTAEYTIEVIGAAGGKNFNGELGKPGVIFSSRFQLRKDQELHIVVGQDGSPGAQYWCLKKMKNCPAKMNHTKDYVNIGAGGGGASIVYLKKKSSLNDFEPLMAAGGGSGGGNLVASSLKSSTKDEKKLKLKLEQLLKNLYLSQNFNGSQLKCSKMQLSNENSVGNGGFGGGEAGTCDEASGRGGLEGHWWVSSNATHVHKCDEENGMSMNDGGAIAINRYIQCPCEQICFCHKMPEIGSTCKNYTCSCAQTLQLSIDGLTCIDSINNKKETAIYPLMVVSICISIFVICGVISAIGLYKLKKKWQREQIREISASNENKHLLTKNDNACPLSSINLVNCVMENSTAVLDDIPHISSSKLRLLKRLGQGAFGEVYEALYYNPHSQLEWIPVAVKTLGGANRKPDNFQLSNDFDAEAIIMNQFNHPNIVRLLGVCKDEAMNHCIVLELLKGGDLREFMRECRPTVTKPTHLTFSDLISLALDIARGCAYLEQKRFVHRDIAARNCLLTCKSSERVAKIADFGMSREMYKCDYYKTNSSTILPVKWMPPEAFLDGVYTTKSDVWSMGVVLWEIFSFGYLPYPGLSNNDAMREVTMGMRMNRPAICPSSIFKMMCECWKTDPNERPTFEELVYRLNEIKHEEKDVVALSVDSLQLANSVRRLINICNLELSRLECDTSDSDYTSQYKLFTSCYLEVLPE